MAIPPVFVLYDVHPVRLLIYFFMSLFIACSYQQIIQYSCKAWQTMKYRYGTILHFFFTICSELV